MPKCHAQLEQEYYESLLKKDPLTITDEDVKFVCRLIEGKTYASGCKYLIQASKLVGDRYLAKYGKATEKHSNQEEAAKLQDIENQKFTFDPDLIKAIQDPRTKYFKILAMLLFTEKSLTTLKGSTGKLYDGIHRVTNEAMYLYLPAGVRDAYKYESEELSVKFKKVSKDSFPMPDLPDAKKLDQLIKTRDRVFQDNYEKLGEGAVRKFVPDSLKGFGFMQKLMQETDVTSTHLIELRDKLSQINNENNKKFVDQIHRNVRKILVSIDANQNRPLEMSQLYFDVCREFIPTEKEINKEVDPAVRASLKKIQLKLQDSITVLEKTVSPSEINKEKGMELN